MREPHGAGEGISRTLPEKEVTGARIARVCRDEKCGNGSGS
jgi:hypothetical protein